MMWVVVFTPLFLQSWAITGLAGNVLSLPRVESSYPVPLVWDMQSVNVSMSMSVYPMHGFMIMLGKIIKW